MTNRNLQDWDNVADKMPQLLKTLQSGSLRNRNSRDFPQSGIYVFYENGYPVYAGRTNRMKQRILEHGRRSSPHNSASFAFLLAVEQAETQGIDCENRNRNELGQDPEFAVLFYAAKERVRQMGVRFVAIDDAIDQTLFEVYAALALGTTRAQGGYNDFDNH